MGYGKAAGAAARARGFMKARRTQPPHSWCQRCGRASASKAVAAVEHISIRNIAWSAVYPWQLPLWSNRMQLYAALRCLVAHFAGKPLPGVTATSITMIRGSRNRERRGRVAKEKRHSGCSMSAGAKKHARQGPAPELAGHTAVPAWSRRAHAARGGDGPARPA